mmetsp:Transcript_29745/g.86196  ORF Transcript_29745/g.86196 Transcript_29745/m.86196 type:complete len:239 (+) Transcript_29745:618-1334(+)
MILTHGVGRVVSIAEGVVGRQGLRWADGHQRIPLQPILCILTRGVVQVESIAEEAEEAASRQGVPCANGEPIATQPLPAVADALERHVQVAGDEGQLAQRLTSAVEDRPAAYRLHISTAQLYRQPSLSPPLVHSHPNEWLPPRPVAALVEEVRQPQQRVDGCQLGGDGDDALEALGDEQAVDVLVDLLDHDVLIGVVELCDDCVFGGLRAGRLPDQHRTEGRDRLWLRQVGYRTISSG